MIDILCLGSYPLEMDLYVWYLNLYCIKIDLHFVPELILYGVRIYTSVPYASEFILLVATQLCGWL